MDNRVGVYVLIKILQNRKGFKGTVYGVFSTQEETGLKGARTAAFNISPDFALVIDTAVAGDTPNVKPQESDIKLNAGPAIHFIEAAGRGAVVPEKVRNLIIKSAKKAKIPYQIEVVEGGMTDAAIIQLIKDGIFTGAISTPTRYIHGANTIVNELDINKTIKLGMEVIKAASNQF